MININYEIVEGNETTPQRIKAVLENGIELWIPLDPNNSDYQEYLNQASQSIPDVTE